MKITTCILALTLLITSATAQEEKKDKKSVSIMLGPDGLKVDDNTKKVTHDKAIDVTFAGVDLGINSLIDKTIYPNPVPFAGTGYLNIPGGSQNKNLFDLRTGKSINVNIWPVLAKVKLLKTNNQKIYLSTGVGLQIYNFRYSNPLEYVNNPIPSIGWDSFTTYKKNKLTVEYLSVPLNLTFKTRMVNKLWLVYGVGITGGYRVNSYTKQVSDTYGKQKDHGNFGLGNFNSTVTAEFGLDNYFRLYASYQLTNMYDVGAYLEQHPFCIGIRLGGI